MLEGDIGILVLLLVCTALEAMLYGFGAGSRQISESEVERRATEDEDKKAIRLLHIIEEPKKYVNTVQFMSTVMLLALGYFARNRVVFYPIILFVILTFGILLPKKMARRKAEKWAYGLVNFASFFVTLLSPLTWIIYAVSNVCLILFGMKTEDVEEDVTEEDIISMVNEGQEQGVIEAMEAEMISNIMEYGDKEAQDIMTHRNQILALDGDMLFSDAVSLILAQNNSRYPVYENTIDHIVGILHFKDAMRYHVQEDMRDIPLRELPGLLREPEFVPETKNIDDLFKEMQKKKLQMVIVIDEYGQTAGLVAMEDILEEIVGNILDEYDEESQMIVKAGEEEYFVDGMTTIEELEEYLSIDLKEDEFDTINGLLTSKMDKIPEEGDEYEVVLEEHLFKVLSVENRRIRSVFIRKLSPSDKEEGEETFLEERKE